LRGAAFCSDPEGHLEKCAKRNIRRRAYGAEWSVEIRSPTDSRITGDYNVWIRNSRNFIDHLFSCLAGSASVRTNRTWTTAPEPKCQTSCKGVIRTNEQMNALESVRAVALLQQAIIGGLALLGGVALLLLGARNQS